MPQPNVNALHINTPLTNVSVAFIQNADNFIADKVFPEVPVDHKSDLYWTIPRGEWLKDEARPRPDATESVGSGYEVAQDSYLTIVEAIHKDIGDQVRANADSPFNLDSDATNFVTQRLLMRKERKFVDAVFKNGVWGWDRQGVDSAPSDEQFIKWSDYDDSNPVKDIKAWKREILLKTGFEPNTLVLGYDVYDALTEHPYFVDRLKYTSSEAINLATIARYFEIDRVFVSKAVVNTAKEGLDDSYGFVLGSIVWLGYVAPTAGLLVPSAGYSFAWRGVSGGLGQTVGVKKFRMEHLAADRVEGQIAVDPKIVASELAAFATNVV